MTKKNYSKYEAKEELVTLSFNHVLLHKKDTKIYQVIFLSLLIIINNPNNSITFARHLTCRKPVIGVMWVDATFMERAFI